MSAAALGADAGSETRSEPLSLLQAAHQQDHQVSVKEQRNRLAMVHDWDTSFDDIQQQGCTSQFDIVLSSRLVAGLVTFHDPNDV